MKEMEGHSEFDLMIENHADDSKQSDKSNNELQKIITLVVVVIRRSKRIVYKYLWLFLIIAICGIGRAAYLILNKEVSYIASVVFILQEENVSGGSNVIDPLSSYLLTRNTSQTINLEKMSEISLSQRVITNLLFNKCLIKGKDDYLINHILVVYYGKENSYFQSFRGLNGLNRSQYSVFNRVSALIRGRITIKQTKAGSYAVSVEMKNEELAKVTTELFYQNLSNFYIDKTTEKAQANYVFLRNRLDSVRNMLYSSEYQVANFEDRARNLLLNTARVPQVRQQRNTEFYQVLYGDLIKSFESSKVTLNNITPVFQLLQRPYYPLPAVSQSSNLILFINMMITGAIMILLLIVVYVKIYIWPEYKYLFKVDKEFT